ncbi:MAG: hypothetical protein KBS74_08920 [Clostridiales bacterium]|nr:hypothetical protein [Candidatus Cacconaster stercorequi]
MEKIMKAVTESGKKAVDCLLNAGKAAVGAVAGAAVCVCGRVKGFAVEHCQGVLLVTAICSGIVAVASCVGYLLCKKD